MLYRIARKEFITAVRDRQVLVFGVLIVALILLAAIAGYRHYTIQNEQITRARQEKRMQWVNQGEKHPHIAAHFGTFLFKPKTGLSFFDFGLDSYTGTSVYLEAHYQHEFMFRPAQDHGSLIRFGELSVALVLQVLLPLLIIFLSFTSFTREKESKTIQLVLSQGVTLRQLAWGKILAFCFIVLLLLLPTLTVAGIWLFSLSGVSFSGDLRNRLLGLGLTYSLYFFVFITLSVYVSAWFAHSRNALLTLLAVWIMFMVILPKTAANIGDTLYTLPSASDLKTAIQYDLDNGLDGNTPREKRMEQLKRVYLAKYRVDSVAQLPLNFEGITMQAGEEYGDQVHDKHWQGVEATLNRQNDLSRYASVLDPYLAIRNLSMALSATDFYTNLDFGRQAENYRRYLIRTMNRDMATHSKLGEFYQYKAGKHLWTSVKDFNYTIPPLSSVLPHYGLEILALLAWSVGLPLAMHLTVNRFSIQ